jgi:hypothetical protein
VVLIILQNKKQKYFSRNISLEDFFLQTMVTDISIHTSVSLIITATESMMRKNEVNETTDSTDHL